MARLTRQQIQDELANLYLAKQELSELDKALNAYAESVMAQARADVEAMRAAQAAQRATATRAIQQAETRLNEGE